MSIKDYYYYDLTTFQPVSVSHDTVGLNIEILKLKLHIKILKFFLFTLEFCTNEKSDGGLFLLNVF